MHITVSFPRISSQANARNASSANIAEAAAGHIIILYTVKFMNHPSAQAVRKNHKKGKKEKEKVHD